jgi:hypothetical protein
MTGSQPDVAKQLRDAAGHAQQNEIENRMQQSEQLIRQGMGSYAVMREAPVTQGLNQLKDDLKNAQQMAAAGGKNGDQGQQAQEGINQIESLRPQMQALAQGQQSRAGGRQPGRQQGQGEKPGNAQGQGQQNGQQQGQQGGGGQQAGNQPGGGGGPQGGGQAGGMREGGQMGNGGGAYNGGGDLSGGNPGGNYGNTNPGNAPEIRTPAQAQAIYNQIVRQLGQLRPDVAGDPQLTRQYQDLVTRAQGLDPAKWGSQDSELAQRIASQALTQLDELELLLRRKADGADGSVRSASPATVAPGYGNAWGEYTKKLSKQ